MDQMSNYHHLSPEERAFIMLARDRGLKTANPSMSALCPERESRDHLLWWWRCRSETANGKGHPRGFPGTLGAGTCLEGKDGKFTDT
jgi:hypothetical protein